MSAYFSPADSLPSSPPSPQMASYTSKYTMAQPHIVSEQSFPSSRKYQYIGGPMESLLSAIDIDNAAPIHLPSPSLMGEKGPILPPLSNYNLPPPSPPLSSSPPQEPARQLSSSYRSLTVSIPPNHTPMSISALLDSSSFASNAVAPSSPKQSTSMTATEYNIASILVSPPMSRPSFSQYQPGVVVGNQNAIFTPPSYDNGPSMPGNVDYIAKSSSHKRKWSDDQSFGGEEERTAKIRRSIRDQIAPMQPPSSPVGDLPSPQHSPRASPSVAAVTVPTMMTTITCLHAAVAQKSYGSEKRFLCPPPVVTVHGPGIGDRNYAEKPQVSMSVVCETGDRSLEQKSMLDENMKGNFKYLHVTGTAKAKQFHLKLKVFGKSSTPYATFDSAPISIISKPSKKTAKARNVSSCILSNSPVSLFNRINSQTVRTKYMGVESNQLCAKNSAWSPFTISIVSPGSPSSSDTSSSSSTSVPITYGTEIVLTDTETGISSEPLVIRKVEKGRVAQGACGPVSQMQKVALQRVSSAAGEPAMYMSAAGAFTEHQDVAGSNNANSFLGYQQSRVVHIQGKPATAAQSPDSDGSAESITSTASSDVVEEVGDYLCWTIVGIAKFQYTFFEALPTTPSSPSTSPSSPTLSSNLTPITPFPTVTSLGYKPSTHTLELMTLNFSIPADHQQHQQQQQPPMEVWLGQHGPLKYRVMRRSASASGPSALQTTTTPSQLKNHLPTNLETSLVIDLPNTQDVVVANHDMLMVNAHGGRTLELPILFVRHDGIVYHSGRCLVCFVEVNGDAGKWAVRNIA
ncbi:hypothetical protein BC936DRAFT_143179 [Jimgerdemannia flammicorona]|uniref:Uncharacterized protein n=1 Tax=Jimgerdemannia flammicorona TaxID=994334 RepID=A0A433DE71_9FUNG|nr:hypothetical protein BC936DRAFT_143179 [Jimgerdemannia flammicorona]